MDVAFGGDAMTGRRFLVALLLAAAGYGSLALLFPRLDSSTTWHQQLGRNDAILHGRTIVRDAAGLDVSAWPATVTTHSDDPLRRYLQKPGHSIPPYLNPLTTYMLFRKPGSEENVGLSLTPDGRPSSLLIHRGSRGAVTAQAQATERDARAALERFLGAPPIGVLSSSRRENDGTRFQWLGTPPHSPELSVTTGCLMRNGRPVEMRAAYALAREAMKTPDQLVVIRVVLVLLMQLAAIVLAVIATVKRRFPARLLFVLIAVVFLTGFAGRIVSPDIDADALEKTENYLRTRQIKDLFVGIGLALMIGCIWAAGHAASRRRFALSTSRFDAILRGRLFSRSVAFSIAIGLMAAGVVAALPYWLAATHVAGMSSVAGTSGGSLFDPSYAALFVPLRWLTLMLVFAFVVPIVADRIRQPAASWLVGAAIGTLIIPGSDRVGSVPGAITLSVLVFLFYDQLLRRVDLVAVLTAGTAASAVTVAATMLAQPAPSIRSSGSAILLGLAIAGTGFLARSLTPGNDENEPLESWSSLDTDAVGERERLLMEMSVAREAQQRMLPLAPPAIPGFSMASICRPATGVGGDLYDFIPLEEGQWGIAVADVSGKGLPAAMYMSMTKGLLLAAVDERSNALEILADVNAGLYSVGQRNVFVTMFFAVLEPRSREVAFVRAGHNAALWRKHATGETVSLTPRGIALGMTGSRMFTRSCAVERLVMEPGDTLFIYSDGVTEAMNEDSVEYGDDRLARAIARADGAGAAAARDLIIQDVSAFVGNTPPNDDLTLVVLQAEPLDREE